MKKLAQGAVGMFKVLFLTFAPVAIMSHLCPGEGKGAGEKDLFELEN